MNANQVSTHNLKYFFIVVLISQKSVQGAHKLSDVHDKVSNICILL